ncbi:HAD family hydrolase [Haloarcula halophila]|uniref:HAD family hydrolase n=1 Tax=Haloarcula TaxID=2237 RepID=UPI0023E397E1|nr:HAD family hydrolase [Halomicroarcula sp. DFY41]
MTTDHYDFWLFDLDGTLVDIEPSYPTAVMSEVGDRLGVGFSEEEARVLWYGIGGARDEFLARREVDPERFWETFHEVENPTDRANATYLYDDAERFLASCEVPVGLVTHCQDYLTGPVLAELNIADWFDTVVCCDDDIGWKPDPTPVERAMRDLGLVDGTGRPMTDGGTEPAGALVGDDPDDIGAARNAGLDGIHVQRRPPAVDGRCVWGDRRVDSLLDLR